MSIKPVQPEAGPCRDLAIGSANGFILFSLPSEGLTFHGLTLPARWPSYNWKMTITKMSGIPRNKGCDPESRKMRLHLHFHGGGGDVPSEILSLPPYSVQGHQLAGTFACQRWHPAHVGSRIQTTIRAASDLWEHSATAQRNSETLSKRPPWVRQYPHLSHSPWWETRPVLRKTSPAPHICACQSPQPTLRLGLLHAGQNLNHAAGPGLVHKTSAKLLD